MNTTPFITRATRARRCLRRLTPWLLRSPPAPPMPGAPAGAFQYIRMELCGAGDLEALLWRREPALAQLELLAQQERQRQGQLRQLQQPAARSAESRSGRCRC